jgi:hypothetical protein
MDTAASRLARPAFLVCAGAMVAHEVDAALRAEWRLLYGLRSLQDEIAASAFVLLHLPLCVAVSHLVAHPDGTVRVRARAAFSAFAVVHAGLHWRLRDDPLSDFSSPASVACIAAGAIGGLAWFAANALARRDGRRTDVARRAVPR